MDVTYGDECSMQFKIEDRKMMLSFISLLDALKTQHLVTWKVFITIAIYTGGFGYDKISANIIIPNILYRKRDRDINR